MNEDIFNTKYKELSGVMYAYLQSLCRDWAAAEDLSQALWVKLHKPLSKGKEFPETKNVYRMAYQIFVDAYRKKKHRSFVFNTEDVPEGATLPARSESSNNEEELSLYNAFWDQFLPTEFTHEEKMIFWYVERYGYTLIETGEKVGLAKSTAHDRLTRVRQQCLEILNKEGQTV